DDRQLLKLRELEEPRQHAASGIAIRRRELLERSFEFHAETDIDLPHDPRGALADRLHPEEEIVSIAGEIHVRRRLRDEPHELRALVGLVDLDEAKALPGESVGE